MQRILRLGRSLLGRRAMQVAAIHHTRMRLFGRAEVAAARNHVSGTSQSIMFLDTGCLGHALAPKSHARLAMPCSKQPPSSVQAKYLQSSTAAPMFKSSIVFDNLQTHSYP